MSISGRALQPIIIPTKRERSSLNSTILSLAVTHRVFPVVFNVRACLHGGRVPRVTELPGKPSYPGRANFSYVSLENAPKHLHARQGNPPWRGILSPCPGHPSRRAIFCHVNGSSRLAEVRRGERTALYFKAAFNVNCLWWLRSINRVQNNSPRHWKAAVSRTSDKKLNLPPKRFCCPPSCLLWLAARSTDYLAQVRCM